MTAGRPAWLRALVNETDVDPKALVEATALEIALSPRGARPARRRARAKPRAPADPAHLPPYDKDLECKHCGKAFRRVCNYREHQRVHSNEYKFACSVQGCDRKFMWRSSIQAHLRSHQAKLDRRRRAARRPSGPASPIAKQAHALPKLPALPAFAPRLPPASTPYLPAAPLLGLHQHLR